MPKPKPSSPKTNTSLAVDQEFREILEAEAKRLGLGWTTMLLVAAREGMAIRQAERAKALSLIG